jgi:hypothetical protein
MTKRPHFASGEGGHEVTGQVVGGGQHVTCDKLVTKNTWTDCVGVRMSQGRIVTADGSMGGQIVWIDMSRGWFGSEKIV